jgi:hypothetical protein
MRPDYNEASHHCILILSQRPKSDEVSMRVPQRLSTGAGKSVRLCRIFWKNAFLVDGGRFQWNSSVTSGFPRKPRPSTFFSDPPMWRSGSVFRRAGCEIMRRKEPRLPAVKVGKLLRFRPEDVERFLQVYTDGEILQKFAH